MRDLERDPAGTANLDPEGAHMLIDREYTKTLKGFVRLQKRRGNANEDDKEAFETTFDKLAERASKLVRIREKIESNMWYA